MCIRDSIYTEEFRDSSMILVRIQLYESIDGSIINTHKPFYFAIPRKHWIVFHSTQTDTHSLLILQAFTELHESTISLERIANRQTTSLHEINLLFGLPSVNTTGFGIWSVYANEESLEPSPLASSTNHPLHTSKRKLLSTDAVKQKEETAMIKFKGSANGVKRQKQYLQKKITQRVYGHNNSDEQPITKYDSLIPVKKVAFNYIDVESDARIRFDFNGRDVFGGLHQLCDGNFLDINSIPDWLCGDYGDKSGTIENGQMVPDQKTGLI